MTSARLFETFGCGAPIANTDNWPNPSATTVFVKALCVIIEAGYSGVKVEYAGDVNGLNVHVVITNLETPEGRLVGALELGARVGRVTPPEQAIATLQRVYSELGLQSPVKAGGKE